VCHEYDIFASTYGILFFGTPHAGSEKADWLSYFQKLTFAASSFRISKSDLVQALRMQSETLQNITDYFVPMMRHFRVYFFWEQKKTDLRLFRKDYVVTVDSAAPAYNDTERAGISADHSGLVKFERPDDPGFLMVVEALLRYCEDAPEVIRIRQQEAAELLERERMSETRMILRNVRDTNLRVNMVPRSPTAGTGTGVDQIDQPKRQQ
jgi:protein SERAC1